MKTARTLRFQALEQIYPASTIGVSVLPGFQISIYHLTFALDGQN